MCVFLVREEEMINWFKQWRVNRLLVKRAYCRGYVNSGLAVAKDFAKLCMVNEQLRQLGCKEEP